MPWLLKMTIIVAALMAATHLYIGWRLKTAAASFINGSLLRSLPVLLLMTFYLLPVSALAYSLFWGDPDLLAWSKVVTYWFWFGLIFSFQMATWLIILDVIKLLTQNFLSRSPDKIKHFYSRAVLIVSVILFVFTAVKMFYDTRQVQTDRISFTSKAIPESFQDFRLIHISDLQGDEYTGREEIARYIEQVNQLKPDMVIFTGDLISYGTDFIDMAAEELSKVQATYGLYAVIGDHDYWAGVPNIEAALHKYDVPLIRDENKIIAADGDSLMLTGITEVYSKHIGRDSLKKLTNAYPQRPLKIMVSHQATGKVVKAAKQSGYEMLLAGHTHGGQLRVPFLGMTFSAAERETPYLSGVYKAGKLFININNGLGFTLAPVRYNAPPNISVIDFRPSVKK